MNQTIQSDPIGEPSYPSQGHAWLIWAVATLFPIYQLAIQIGYVALESGIDRDLNLSLARSAILSSSFLLVYSLMQVPAGLLLDRFSPRILLTSSAILCGLSAWAFGGSQSFAAALLFRALLGATASFGFPGAGLLGRRWINPARFVLAMGLIDFFFGFGAVAGESGFAALRDSGVTWREIMNLLAIAGILIGLFCMVFVRDRPAGMADRSDRVYLGDAMRVLFSNRQVLLSLVFYAGMIGVAFGFGGLWDIRLQGAFGFGEKESVFLNSWLFVGLALSAPLAGVFADRIPRRKPLLLFGTIGSLLGVAGLLFIPLVIPYWAIVANLLFTGATLGTSVAIFGVACDAVPPRYAATTIGLVNAAGCLLGALLQVVPGLLLGPGDWHPLSVYQQVLSLNIAVLVAASLAVCLLRERQTSH
jgi:MFS family permease